MVEEAAHLIARKGRLGIRYMFQRYPQQTTYFLQLGATY
jgi:hypothetical protein